MRAVRRVTDTRDRGSALGEGMPGHTAGYVEAGRVPGHFCLRQFGAQVRASAGHGRLFWQGTSA